MSENEIKRLVLEFPHGESVQFCQYISEQVNKYARSRLSEGGFTIKYMPITKEDEQLRGMEFEDDEMTFVYSYPKEKCPPHSWDRSGERCIKCGDKDWMT